MEYQEMDLNDEQLQDVSDDSSFGEVNLPEPQVVEGEIHAARRRRRNRRNEENVAFECIDATPRTDERTTAAKEMATAYRTSPPAKHTVEIEMKPLTHRNDSTKDEKNALESPEDVPQEGIPEARASDEEATAANEMATAYRTSPPAEHTDEIEMTPLTHRTDSTKDETNALEPDDFFF